MCYIDTFRKEIRMNIHDKNSHDFSVCEIVMTIMCNK